MSHIVWFKGNIERQINVQICKNGPRNQICVEEISYEEKKIKTRCFKVKKMFSILFYLYKNG